MKRALILGVGGQDASYLVDILLEKGYEVHGLYRRSSTGNLRRIEHVLDRVTLHMGDMADQSSIERALLLSDPDEVYNEADQDSVGWSHAAPNYSYDITFAAVGRLLEILRGDKDIRIFQPCTAMMFGDAALLNNPDFPQSQNEETPLRPMSPYACAKAGAYHLCRFYREVHGMFVSVGILYNHDSPRRTEEYLLHKICKAAVRIARGQQETLALGNLDARVDIGYALEYMEAAWNMLQLGKSDDFVIATGAASTIEYMVRYAFACAGVTDPMWRVTRDEKFWHPAKGVLRGDWNKANETFGFIPHTTSLKLIEILIKHFEEQP